MGRRRARGFTLVEILVVIGIVVLLIGILLPVVTKARNAAKSTKCLSNLRQIAVGFHVYAGDNFGKLPDPGLSDLPWERVLAGYLKQDAVYECPADEEVFPVVGSSYDWRDTGDPDTTLAGRPLSDAKAIACVLAFDALPHWHAKGKMNVAWTDTSASPVDVEEGLEDLMDGVKKDRKKPKKPKKPKGGKDP
jgi:prepilin-type N-terminal cleavage/methylation domain-containing protein